MSALTERLVRMIEARVAWERGAPTVRGPLAADLVREVLAVQLEPSPAVLDRVRNVIEAQGGPSPPDAAVRLTIREMVDAFAREHGLEPHPSEEQQP